VAAAKVTQPVQHVGHPQGHGGLAGAGAAGETHVQVRSGGRQTEPAARSINQQECRDLADPGLDRGQTDQVGVQGIEDLINAGGFAFLGEIDPGVRR